MFDKLIRRVLDVVPKARIGFLSEPTAIVGSDARDRKIQVVALEEWLKHDQANGPDAASASLHTGAHGGAYALVVTAANPTVTVVELGTDEHVARFTARFLGERKATRVLTTPGSIREARINPPPPPPPPTDEFLWGRIARLDATLRVITLDVIGHDYDGDGAINAGGVIRG